PMPAPPSEARISELAARRGSIVQRRIVWGKHAGKYLRRCIATCTAGAPLYLHIHILRKIWVAFGTVSSLQHAEPPKHLKHFLDLVRIAGMVQVQAAQPFHAGIERIQAFLRAKASIHDPAVVL